MRRKTAAIAIALVLSAAAVGCSEVGTAPAAPAPAAEEAVEEVTEEAEAVEEENEEAAPEEEAVEEAAPEEEEAQAEIVRETYQSADGWSVRYDPEAIEVQEGDGFTSFVYTGESAGTCMMTVTPVADKGAVEALDELTAEWGDPDAIQSSEAPFLGDESTIGYWRVLEDSGEGSGLSETAIGIDYKGGALIFDILTHRSGEDEIDIPVSDAISEVLDSFDAGEVDEAAAEEGMTTDIEGCETFTQIVDKLEDGRGYANETVGDADVLLVSEGTFDNLDGNEAAIDSELFIYDSEGVPAYIGSVSSGSTATPLAIKDGEIYVASHHFITRYTVEAGELVVVEDVREDFDEDGEATYSVNGEVAEDQEAAKARFDEMFEEYGAAQVIGYSTVSHE